MIKCTQADTGKGTRPWIFFSFGRVVSFILCILHTCPVFSNYHIGAKHAKWQLRLSCDPTRLQQNKLPMFSHYTIQIVHIQFWFPFITKWCVLINVSISTAVGVWWCLFHEIYGKSNWYFWEDEISAYIKLTVLTQNLCCR